MPKVQLGTLDNVRLMLYGQPGTGKTYTWLKMCLSMPNARFHVIDIDNGVNAVIRGFTPEEQKTITDRMDYYLCNDWPDVKDSFDEIRKNAKPADWLILEQTGQLWDMVQEYYVKRVFDGDLGEFFTQLRSNLEEQNKKGKLAQASLDGWKDWAVIKKLHNQDFMDVFTKRLACNVMLTASASKLSEQFEKPDTLDIFGRCGWKPEGEKHNIYRVDGIVLLWIDKEGKFWMRTMKSRGVPEFTEKLNGRTAFEIYMAKRDRLEPIVPTLDEAIASSQPLYAIAQPESGHSIEL